MAYLLLQELNSWSSKVTYIGIHEDKNQSSVSEMTFKIRLHGIGMVLLFARRIKRHTSEASKAEASLPWLDLLGDITFILLAF